MNNERITISRDERSLEFYIDRAIPINLAHVFLQITSGKTVADFFNDIVIPMSVSQIYGDELLEKVYESGYSVSTKDILLISCAYLNEAKHALKKGNRRAAWSAAMEAMSYCASAKNAGNYVQGLSGAIAEEVQEALSMSAAKAAELRAAPYKEIGAAAVHIITERGERGDRWRSASAAAIEIRDEVNVLAKAKGLRFNASDGGVRTIAGYLKAAPDLAPYFLEKRGRPKKKDR